MRVTLVPAWALCVLSWAGCPAPAPAPVTGPAATVARPAPTAQPVLELVESWPVETGWDQPDIRDASVVWVEMIKRAKRTLDIAQFYLAHEPGKALQPVLDQVIAAGKRGVKVRVLVEKKFLTQSEVALELLEGKQGIEVAHLDLSGRTGGILHAKYFVVDRREAFVGSQNFDWRALTHIHELGLRIVDAEVVGTLLQVFEADWSFARHGEDRYAVKRPDADRDGLPDAVDPRPDKPTWAVRRAEGLVQLFLVASPPKLNPPGIPAAANHLVRLLDGAKKSVVVQLLGYQVRGYQGDKWTVIDDALRRAAARGVKIRLNCSHWAKAWPKIAALKALVRDGVAGVVLNTIPEHSSGFIPYARVDHVKYMVVDGKVGWIGTSNWGGDYFTASRNVEVIFRAPALVARLARLFDTGWNGPYGEMLDPEKRYEKPRKK